MARIAMIFLVVALAASSVSADTKNGNANSTSWARYFFITPADGDFNASVVWTNADVDIWWVLICGGNNITAANGLGLQDRIAHLVVGIPGGVGCTLFLSTLAGATAFRLHAQHASDLSTKQGIAPLQLIEGGGNRGHEAVANQLLQLRAQPLAP
jgi:hypothetical protein